MSDEGYPASAWDHTDNETLASTNYQNLRVPQTQPQPYHSDDSLVAGPPTDVLVLSKSNTSPRSSVESPTRMANQRWSSVPPSEPVQSEENIVEAGFDENVLHALLELDCGTPLLLDRIKQSMASCREVSVFLKKRAVYEDEYGRNMQKLAKATAEAYAINDGKAGSFVVAWQNTLKTHENVAENRLRFAQRLNEMSEELANLAKEVDKTRKQTKDLATRYERSLQEAEATREKAKSKFDLAAEELERLLLQKEGESVRDTGVQGRSPGGVGGKRVLGKAVAKGGMLLKGKNPGNIQRQEDDIRTRVSVSSDAFRKAVQEAQGIRQEYFNFQLPRILRSLKECADEIDLGTQYHLTRYAFLYENAVLSDGSILVPSDEDPSLKAIFESIDNRKDFKTFMQNYAYAHNKPNPRAPRRVGPKEDGFVPPILPLTYPHDRSSASR
ncbi:hypothetical protein QCA50_009770 [Cerrena zonata]|uniref:F-BAR domain-containing protein n=1 Tax=Cerrena zonata TaxID=2478898 RepID=A0AAW0GDY9_9APHY